MRNSNIGEIAEEEDEDLVSKLDAIKDPFADDASSTLDHDYDVINLKEEGNPYQAAVRDAFKLFFEKNPDHGSV